ncbi:unnamed protein product [Sphagnum troendelagicum]|uniref:Uncharacterized protein n=1 Tax=Sphagnum troendelagicum TaxID=128251 RepID=A0ABP0ULW0_9BRYO
MMATKRAARNAECEGWHDEGTMEDAEEGSTTSAAAASKSAWPSLVFSNRNKRVSSLSLARNPRKFALSSRALSPSPRLPLSLARSPRALSPSLLLA